MVRLIATDLDGTLLRDQPPISPRVVAALARVQAAGVVVVLVTARNWRSVGDIAEQAGVRGLAICSNGAIVFDLDRKDVHRAHTTAPPDLHQFVDACLNLEGASVGWETATQVFRTPVFHELAVRDGVPGPYLAAVEIVDRISHDHEVTKLLVRHPTLPVDTLLARLSVHARGVTLTVSGGQFVEVTAEGVTKASALAELCQDLGIDRSEVVAIGDQPNDIPMLTWAGHGVAMGNSHPEVLAAVNERTATNLEDGVALVLEGLLAGR